MIHAKTKLGFLFAALLLLFVSVRPAIAQSDYGGDIDYQGFYDELEPYGQWVSDPDYGYVWIPDAGDDFRPYYSNGYWAYTDYGNTWVSSYPWGWAPFHYGRWTYNSYYGWMWIPGNVWGPAWVSWRSGGGCYGWAPLGPGISINIAIGGYNCPSYWWNFAPQQYIFNRNWNRYSYGPSYNNTYINRTTIINNTYVVNHNTYLGGPRRDDLRQAIGRDPRPLAINNTRGPQRAQVRGNQLNIYRPAVSDRPRANMRPQDFRTVERPIRGNTPSDAAGFGSRQDARPNQLDRNPVGNPSQGSQTDRGSMRNRSNPGVIQNRQPGQPDNQVPNGGRRQDQGGNINQTPAQPNPDRPVWNTRPQPGGQVQPQPNPRPSVEPRQQQPQRSFEQPRQPQVQPQQQPQQAPRSFDRPQVQPQRSFEQPRPQVQPQRSFEQPRPQMQPQRSFERPEQARPEGGGRRFGR